ncbi:hypothetical protein V2J09_001225 [Rumex salicifolius]
MASMAMLQSLIFPPPPSVFVTAMTAVSSLSMANAGINEFKGKHLQYSKMVSANSGPKIPSKVGMTLFYLPAFLVGVASFFVFPAYDDTRFLLIRAALTLHFLKRLLETWFVHKYSGEMTIEAAITIPFSYSMATLTMIYTQSLSLGLQDPSIDLKYVGSILFTIGTCGNFYHHYLLSALRKNGEKEYKIPKGGLFDQVICPHYLFEMMAFWGFAFVSQTLYALGFTVGTSLYLIGRSYGTRKWYASKFDDFPEHVKAVIPYIF